MHVLLIIRFQGRRSAEESGRGDVRLVNDVVGRYRFSPHSKALAWKGFLGLMGELRDPLFFSLWYTNRKKTSCRCHGKTGFCQYASQSSCVGCTEVAKGLFVSRRSGMEPSTHGVVCHGGLQVFKDVTNGRSVVLLYSCA